MTATNSTETDAASSASRSATSAELSLAWGTTEFQPGVDVALVARQTVGLIERDNPSTRARLWRLVSDDAPLDDILDELSSTGLKALPAFGLAQIEGSAIRIVARGRVTIVAELASGSTRVIDPSGVRTWIEELLGDVAGITITLTALDGDSVESSGETFAVLAGSVPASSLSRRYDAADDHAHAAESDGGWTAGRAAASSEAVAPVSSSSDAAGEQPAPAMDVERGMVEKPESESVRTPSADTPLQPKVESAARPNPAPVDPVAATPDPRPSDQRPSDPQPADPRHRDQRPADPQPASPQPPPPNEGSPPRTPSSPAAGGVPPSAPAPESTIIVGSGARPTRSPGASIFDDDIEGPNDDAADAAAPSSDAPVYGVLSFSNGERIDVDRAILIGRNPKVTGAVEGALPRIMKFDGPGQGLSRTHAEVRVEDGEVLIEDLESTNGTEVQLPGQQRRRLRGGDPMVIVHGTLIDFGDELRCTLESAS